MIENYLKQLEQNIMFLKGKEKYGKDNNSLQ